MGAVVSISTDMPRFQVVYLQRDLVGCPRCAGAHPGLGYRRFTRVADPAAARFPFWALCPVTGEPLLLAADQAPSPASIFAELLAPPAKQGVI